MAGVLFIIYNFGHGHVRSIISSWIENYVKSLQIYPFSKQTLLEYSTKESTWTDLKKNFVDLVT